MHWANWIKWISLGNCLLKAPPLMHRKSFRCWKSSQSFVQAYFTPGGHACLTASHTQAVTCLSDCSSAWVISDSDRWHWVLNTNASSETPCRKPPGWCLMLLAGFFHTLWFVVTVWFYLPLKCPLYCWARHSSVREPLAFLCRKKGWLHLGATERHKASVPVHMLRPLLLCRIMIALWDVNRS